MARQIPVTVYMNYQSIKSPPSQKLMDDVRCKRVAFREVVYTGYDGKPIEEVLRDCLLAPAPHLRSLDIAVSRGSGLVLQNKDSDSQGAQVNLVTGSNLTSVRLSNVYIPWSAAILQGLHSLSLEYLNMAGTNRTSPTLRDLLKILQGCPELRSLTLRYLTLCPDDQREAPTRISLDKLGQIYLSGRALRPTCDILQYIEYPRTAKVSVSDENRVLDDGWQVDIGVVLSQLAQNQIIAPLHLKIVRSRLTLSAINYQIDIPSPNEESASSRITYKDLLYNLDALTLAAVTSLHMGSSASQNSTAILMAANDLFPNLTKLSISPYQRLKSKKPWHVVLEKVVQSADEVNRLTFLCPNLTSLEIATADGDCPDLSSILQLVRIRNSDKKSKGKRVERSPITSISMNLESGKLSSEQQGLLKELKGDVDNVHCVSPLL
ncbi:hypothetical protein FS837_011037 [Tulasnella sp. UAMH 9824]|nr:hypothetical protein FS837_011037 [Tulasnella sp. UAMH 9824]